MVVYPAIFHKSIEGGYVVVFPDFDYGVAEGKTLEKTIEMSKKSNINFSNTLQEALKHELGID